MITILKSGRFRDMQQTCRVCGCEFMFDISDCDVAETRYANAVPYTQTFRIDCPICRFPVKFEILVQPDKEASEDA